jgi:DNA-binding NtrC family response regulator
MAKLTAMSSQKSPNTEIMRTPSNRGLRIELQALDMKVLEGSDSGLTASFSLPTVRIGTASDNDLILTDRTVSRHHAEIRITPQGCVLRDLDSTNGTFIGNVRLTEAVLEPKIECRLGYSRLSIRQRTDERAVAVSQDSNLGHLVGASQRMRELFGLISAAAPTAVTVLINGESGSGKELVARTLHELSGRSGPLVVFDASVTDPEMVRNDLFGHMKGAFTGASGTREGAFRRAQHGTLFIDEIGELPLDLQPRLLRALENREITPIGSDTPVRVDVRVVAATHRSLEQMVEAGAFRSDLYYRLSVVPVRVPPLREIADDIPLLVEHFRNTLGLTCRVSEEAMAALQNYPWPGNVRELRNVLERAAVLLRGDLIRIEDLRLPDRRVAAAATNSERSPPRAADLKHVERQMIRDALARSGNNKAAAARDLGMSLSTLKRRLSEYGD